MPSNLLGVAFYIFALFPGVAFLFAREGHKPVGPRSVLRETATVVFVSSVCDAVVALMVVVAAGIWPEVHRIVIATLQGDFSWAILNFGLATVMAIAALACSTLLGFFLGTKWAHERGLKHIWRSEIERDVSAWERILHPEDEVEVRVGLNLKSGTWITGTLFHFDNDPDSNSNRSITLNGDIQIRPQGQKKAAPLTDTDWLIVQSGEIEMLQAAYYEPAQQTTKIATPQTRTRAETLWKTIAYISALVIAAGGCAQLLETRLTGFDGVGTFITVLGLGFLTVSGIVWRMLNRRSQRTKEG